MTRTRQAGARFGRAREKRSNSAGGRGVSVALLTLWLIAGGCFARARAQEPSPTPTQTAPTQDQAQPAQASEPATDVPPASTGARPPVATPESHPSSMLSPVLLLTQGLDELLANELRRRLSEALARDVVPLMDPRARRVHASIFAGLDEHSLVLRVTPLQRAEVWRQLSRSELGADPVAVMVKAILEMLWADAFARLDVGEVQDPFCPSGMICVDPRHQAGWPSRPELEVLDPWDTTYRRFGAWDPYFNPGSPINPWAPPYAQRSYRPAPIPAWPTAPEPAIERRRQDVALGLLAGGGVTKGGAFLRYEVNLLRRYPRFDFGLSYLGARGQPEPFQKARRAALAMLQRRFVSPDFELDLGLSFGVLVATHASSSTEVRPYLRGLLTFALPVSHSFDLLVQSDLGSTFTSVRGIGAVEYALSAGFRHKF
ncbi:MAG: hypothetical protein QM778_10765 [Myxococcales bacterium]